MADMEPVYTEENQPVQVLSTPPFSSNDPATDGLKMVPIDDNPPADDFPESDIDDDDDTLVVDPRVPDEAEEGASTEDDANKKAAEWVAEIKATETQEALDAVLARYEATGKDFTTVAEAAEARQDDLDNS